MGRQEDTAIETESSRNESFQENEDESTEVTLETDIVPRNTSDVSSAPWRSHPLWPDIEKISLEQLHYARQEVGHGWQLLEKDGDMIMYKREKEINGHVEDPLKASHTVKGVTAFEMCHYFFQPEFRLEWEETVDNVKVVERIADNTLIFHQLHKRYWPAAARDAAFWSHMRSVSSGSDIKTDNLSWMVCNRSLSVEHPLAPVKKGNIRAFLTVILLCETIIEGSSGDGAPSRDGVTCKITYCSAVKPGGWAPAAIVREIAKTAYSKFLKTFTAYVARKCKGQPVRFS